MNKQKLKKALREKTDCIIQGNGWTCGTCFFAMSKKLTEKDWQVLLSFRGDYKDIILDYLSLDIKKSLEKIYKIAVS